MDFDRAEMERIVDWIINANQAPTHRVHRPYFLVIFNNRQWSDYFRQRRAEEMQWHYRFGQPYLCDEPAISFRQSWLENQFNHDLRQLVTGYMRETQRRFPLKYFTDFTES